MSEHLGAARLAFQASPRPGKTAVATAFATSPLRLLTPRNHGEAAWVFLASLGGGLLDGDRIDVDVDVAAGASALLGTQASTKVYRSPPGGAGSSQTIRVRVGAGGLLVLLPDPVVCFADARYEQAIDVELASSASLCVLDSYTCGRSARGERWAFSRYASRLRVTYGGVPRVVDAVTLDPRSGALVDRMGRFDAFASLLVLGPRMAPLRAALVASVDARNEGSSVAARNERPPPDARSSRAVLAVSALPPRPDADADGCVARVAAERFEIASLALRSSFAELARVLGDDPFARKW